MTGQDSIEHGLLVHLIGTCFDHNDLLGTAGNGQIQVILLALLKSRIQNDLTVDQTNTDASDRAVPRNIGNRDCNGCCDHAGDLRRAIRIYRQNGHDNGYIVTHILREQRTNRTVNHSGGQNCLFRRLALALSKGAGDSADGIHSLLIVHGQREEVDAVTRLCTCGDIGHDSCIAIANPAGTVGQFAGLAGLYDQLSACICCFKYSVLFKHSVTSFFDFNLCQTAF